MVALTEVTSFGTSRNRHLPRQTDPATDRNSRTPRFRPRLLHLETDIRLVNISVARATREVTAVTEPRRRAGFTGLVLLNLQHRSDSQRRVPFGLAWAVSDRLRLVFEAGKYAGRAFGY